MATNTESFDKAILAPDFSWAGAHLVEASAGTGKTYCIQNIYARLVLEKGLKVSEIQVMTFTVAATKELRDRLHTVLADLQLRFAEPPVNCPGRNEDEVQNRNQRADALIGCVPPDKRVTARNQLELALLEFDHAAISTIHGFCQRILTRYALAAGINLAAKVEANQKIADLEIRAENWWRKRPADLPDGGKLSSLKKDLQTLSAKAEYELEFPDPASLEAHLLNAAQEIIAAYEQDAPNRETMDFDDLLRAVWKALKPENPRSKALIAQLRQEFKAALIDEFQDTDPVQYEIFERIFLDGGDAPLFLVGDPKQAIYAFRGGDIYAYLEAKSNPALQIGTLNVNHRSVPKLVDAVNAMFRDEDGAYTFGEAQIGYTEPVRVEKAPDTHGHLLPERPFSILEVPWAQGKPAEKDSAVQNAMVEQILELLQGRGNGTPYSPKDIAILTNANAHNVAIRELLRKKNIPSVIRNAGNVFSAPIAVELRTFLLAVADPADQGCVLAALLTVFGGKTVDTLPGREDPAALGPFLQTFRIWNECWEKRGLAALVAALEETGYRERLAARQNGERQLADLEQIWELAFAAVKQIGPNTEALLGWLTERINASEEKHGDTGEKDESKSEEYCRELEVDEEAVKIMTIHVSKGLQFPVVFLPDCWNVDWNESSSLSAFHENGKLIFSFSDEAKAKSNAEQHLEKIRLLYVAMTRAVERMILVTPGEEKWGKNEPLHGLLANLERRSADPPPYQRLVLSPQESAENYRGEKKADDITIPALPPPDLRAWRSPFKGSYSSLFPASGGGEGEDERDVDWWSGNTVTPENVHPIFTVPEGAAAGTCLHNILEKVSFQADEAEIRELANQELADAGIRMPGGDSACIVQMIRQVLAYPLCSPSGESFALSNIPWSKRLSEQEFEFATGENAAPDTQAIREILERHWRNDPDKAEFLQAMAHWKRPIPKGFITGFIDLIFQQGTHYYVVDWKSNSLDKSAEAFNAEGIRREMAVHGYFFQYLLYAVVLHKVLKQTLGSGYCWQEHFGGIRYFFLRGIAAGGEAPVFADRPTEALLEELGRALGLEA